MNAAAIRRFILPRWVLKTDHPNRGNKFSRQRAAAHILAGEPVILDAPPYSSSTFFERCGRNKHHRLRRGGKKIHYRPHGVEVGLLGVRTASYTKIFMNARRLKF